MLTAFLRNLRHMLDSRTFRREFLVEGQEIPHTLCTTDHSGAAGRPRYAVTEAQIRMLKEEGFRWADIAHYFGVSPITLRRRRRGCDMPVGENFHHISDDELDTLVARVLHSTPQAGLNLVLGAARARGLRLQRERIHDSMIRVNPVTSTLRNSRRKISRRTYNVPCPNDLW